MNVHPNQPNFDRVARPYHLLERITMGRLLERTRFAYLKELATARRALVIGDGDGRFCARLLETNPVVEVTAVDLSPAMLKLLRRRCSKAVNRLVTVEGDALVFCQSDQHHYDLVTTHFLLDCLPQPKVEELAQLVVRRMQPKGRWVISEFAVPEGLLRLPARALVQGLYVAFLLLTGLRIDALPDHATALTGAGFVRSTSRTIAGGLLCAELWELPSEDAAGDAKGWYNRHHHGL